MLKQKKVRNKLGSLIPVIYISKETILLCTLHMNQSTLLSLKQLWISAKLGILVL